MAYCFSGMSCAKSFQLPMINQHAFNRYSLVTPQL